MAHVYDVTLADLRSAARTKDVADARDVAAYLLHTDHGLGGDQVGRLLGRRHRATVACAWATIARRLASGDAETATALAGARRLIAGQPSATERPERPQAAATPLDVYWRIARRRDLWGRRIAM